MDAYYKCRRCYSFVREADIGKHHAVLHADIPYENFKNEYFIYRKPYYECDYCSCRLKRKEIKKHFRYGHPNVNLLEKESLESMLFDSISESEDENVNKKTKRAKSSANAAIQNNGKQLSNVDQPQYGVTEAANQIPTQTLESIIQNKGKYMGNDDNDSTLSWLRKVKELHYYDQLYDSLSRDSQSHESIEMTKTSKSPVKTAVDKETQTDSMESKKTQVPDTMKECTKLSAEVEIVGDQRFGILVLNL